MLEGHWEGEGVDTRSHEQLGGLRRVNGEGKHVPHMEGKEEPMTWWSGLGNRLSASKPHTEDPEELLGGTHAGACDEEGVPGSRPDWPDMLSGL